MTFDLECTEEREARNSLLKHYSSECVAHGAHIITWLLAFLAFTQSLDKIPLPNDWTRSILVAVILSIFATGVTYSIGRLLYWSHLVWIVMETPLMGEQQTIDYTAKRYRISEKEVRTLYSINALSRLNHAVSERIGKDARFHVKFFGTKSLRHIISITFLVWLAFWLPTAIIYLIMFGQIKVTFN